jgi:hypothetical protein
MKNFRFTTKLLMGAAIAFAAMAPLTSCSDDDDDDEDPTPTTNNNGGGGCTPQAPTLDVNLDIDADRTWSKDTVYILRSRIKVRPGATLTIQPGTVIKGDEGQGNAAVVLMVMRGARINANGTAQEPIIFTSIRDCIEPGQIASPNLPSDLQGQWGGLAILGNGIISSGNPSGMGYDEDNIEGVPTSDSDGLYGGNDSLDNSGTLRYVSVRHGGTEIAPGDELNGISFGGVGSGTTVENIEIVGNADDGVEFYGGSVNVTNLVVWNNGDDAIDTDQDYVGTIDNGYIVGPEGSCFELDGPEGSIVSGKNHTIRNITVVAVRGDGTAAGDLLNFDSNTNISMDNIYWATVDPNQKIGKANTTSAGATFSNLTINVASTAVNSYLPAGFDPKVSAALSAGTTSPTNAAPFNNWTWAGTANNLGSL